MLADVALDQLVAPQHVGVGQRAHLPRAGCGGVIERGGGGAGGGACRWGGGGGGKAVEVHGGPRMEEVIRLKVVGGGGLSGSGGGSGGEGESEVRARG